MLTIKGVFVNPFSYLEKGVPLSYSLLFLALFLLCPTLALVLATFIVFADRSKSKQLVYLFFFVLAGWMGVLNMTKQLFSDQIYYAKIFMEVDTGNIVNAVLNYRYGVELREPIFNLFSVICRLFVGPNPRAYFFVCTFVFYLLHYFAIDKLLSASQRSKLEIILTVIFISFFAPLFWQSVHLLRQNLAMSLVIYAIAYRATEGRHLWLFLIMAFFTHNMTAFFIVLALIPWLYEKLTIKRTILLFVGFSVFMLCYYNLGLLLATADMAGVKAVGNTLSNSGDEVEFYSAYATLVYAIPSIVGALCIMYRNVKQSVPEPLITIVYVFLMTFILIMSFSNHQTLQARYAMCLFSFMPFVLLFPMRNNNPFQMCYCITITAFFTFRFFYIDVNWREFATWTEILSDSFLHFWNTTYYSIQNI